MSYQGNEYTMDMVVHRIRLKYPDMDYIIVIGDQQTYDRIVRLKCADPPGYKWLVPMCGEMHVMAHDCNSTWKLWWSPMMQDLVEHCDMGTSTHRKGLLEDPACNTLLATFRYAPLPRSIGEGFRSRRDRLK